MIVGSRWEEVKREVKADCRRWRAARFVTGISALLTPDEKERELGIDWLYLDGDRSENGCKIGREAGEQNDELDEFRFERPRQTFNDEESSSCLSTQLFRTSSTRRTYWRLLGTYPVRQKS